MKTTLRLILLAAVIILSVTALIAQTKDIVYLKNGSVIKGAILEMIPDKTIKIQTADGNIFVYNMSEVEKISKEAAAPSNESKPFNERSNNEGQRSYEGQRSEGAGSSFIIYGGAAIPLGDFAKDIPFEDLANNNNIVNAGFAKTGWLAGMQFVTGGTIGFLIDASYSAHPTKIDKYFSSALRSSLPSFKIDTTVNSGSSIVILAGIKFGTSNPTGANLFLAPVIGIDIVKTPNMSAKFSGVQSTGYYDTYYPYTYHPGYYVDVNGEASVPSVSKTVVVYGATLEAILGGITIGARYLTCKPKYDMEMKVTATASYQGQSATQNETDKFQWEPNISLVQVYLGIAF